MALYSTGRTKNQEPIQKLPPLRAFSPYARI